MMNQNDNEYGTEKCCYKCKKVRACRAACMLIQDDLNCYIKNCINECLYFERDERVIS